MSRRRILSAALLAAALVLAIVAVVRSGSREAAPPATAGAPAAVIVPPAEQAGSAPPSPADEESAAPPPAPLRHLNVQIYFPSVDEDGLVGEPREIFETAAPGDRAKQIIADLISGPGDESLLRALPRGTQVLQVFVLQDGTAYVDFSGDLRQGMRGGSTEELLAVYAIVNSVALNVPEVRRLGILIDGRPIETLNGHMDLRRPLPPDTSLILRGRTVDTVRRAGGEEARS